MPFLIEHIVETVYLLMAAIILITGLLIAIALVRRRWRNQYFRRLDAFRLRFRPLIVGILKGKVEYERGLKALSAITGPNRCHYLELLLFEARPRPEEVNTLRRLAEDLGLVRTWQYHLSIGPHSQRLGEALSGAQGFLGMFRRLSFLVRATSAQYLGIIQHQASWPILVKALRDPHPDVASVAARAIASIGARESFEPLLERLLAVIQNPSSPVSLRSLKMALVSFPLDQSPKLLPALQNGTGRIRFMAVDIIREMVEREASRDDDFILGPRNFAPELSELFLTRLPFDDNPDVRARTACVLAPLADPRVTSVLLILLSDAQWFVRMHAARSLGKRNYTPRASAVARHLTDTNWMVRQAASRTLLSFGRPGMDQLFDQILNTHDRYCKEQIADDIQRAGLVPTLLAQFASGTNGREAQVVGQFANLGKTSYLLASLDGSSDEELRGKFLSQFGNHPDPQIRAWAKTAASRQPDPNLGLVKNATLKGAA